MFRVKLITFSLILFLFIQTPPVLSEETAADPTKVYSLGEVVVSGNSVGSQVNTQIEITHDDIEKKNIKTLDKALELLPGVDVSKGTAGIPRVNIRGFRSRHTTLLLNGIPINSTWDQQFDPHLIPAENIAKIKVSYGTHSALYGQGGLAGVINIITKQGTQGLHVDASGDMDERGNHYSKANVSGGSEKVDFFASVSQSHSDGFLLSDNFDSTGNEDGGVRENSDDKRLSVFGNLGFKVNDQLALGLTMDHANGEFGIPHSTLTDNTDPFYKKAKFDRVEDFDTFSTQVSADFTPGGMFGLRGWAFINTHDQEYARYDDADYNSMTRKNSYLDKTETQITGATLQPSLNFGNAGELVMSFSGQKDEYTSDLAIVERNGDPAVRYNYDYDLEMYSAAAEYRINPVAPLDLVAGFSHHWQQKDIGSDDDKSGYMIGASFAVTDTTRIRASYAKKIRFPSIRQLYDSSSGDNTLKPEESNNWEAGISQDLPWGMNLDVGVFLSDVENYIEKDDVTDKFANNDEYEFKGFEARLAKSLFDMGQIGVSYSYLETKDKSSGSQKDELQYRPEHKFVVDASYTFDFGLTASADATYIGKQYYYNNTFQKGELSDYTVVNLRLEQRIYKQNLSIYIGADNIFDENYQESYGFPQPGRTAYAGLRVRF